MSKFENVLFTINAEIAEYRRRNKWRRKEINKELPYKCITKADAKRKRAEFRRDIAEAEAKIKEYKKAIKILSNS